MMSQQRQFHQMVGGNNNILDQYNDTTFTKLFVGGLAWETQRDTLRRYFEQFGEILEAVVITDKNTGRSKGYGFVTFKDPEAAMRACQNPSPVIDGRRANCNLASLGANKNRPPPPIPQHGAGRFRPPHGLVASSSSYHHGSTSSLLHQPPIGQYTFPYSSSDGYSGYSQDTLYPGGYYNVYGGQQQISPYIYPFYGQYAHGNQAHGFGFQYLQMAQFPFLPQHYYGSTGTLSFPYSMAVPTTTSTVSGAAAAAATARTTATTTTRISQSVAAATVVVGSSSQASTTASEQNPNNEKENAVLLGLTTSKAESKT